MERECLVGHCKYLAFSLTEGEPQQDLNRELTRSDLCLIRSSGPCVKNSGRGSMTEAGRPVRRLL